MNYFNKGIIAAKRKYLWWQEKGLQETASGYGRKLTTSIMILLEGEKVWRRVYMVCFSNSGTIYIIVKGRPSYFTDNSEIRLENLLTKV